MRKALISFVLFYLIFSSSYAITIDMRRDTKRKGTGKAPFAGMLEIKEFRLRNGLNVYLIPKRDGSGNASVFLWVKSGASDEPENFIGGAHILEHVVFKGSPERGVSEVSDAIERVGGYINAWTSYDDTVYWSIIPSEHISVPLEVLRDIVWNPAFSDEEFEREKEVVLEEWRRSQDLPSYRLAHRFFEEIYKGHPYGRPVIGYENTIMGITKELTMRYHSMFYSPENAFLIVAGDFDDVEVLKKIRKLYEGVAKGKEKRINVDVRAMPDFSGPRSFIISGKEKEAQVVIGFLGYPYSLTHTVYLDLAADILERRLYEKLRLEDVIVNSVDADYWSPRGVGLFEIFFSANAENIGRALDVIYDELLRMRTFGVSERELEGAKSSALSSFHEALQSVRTIGRVFGYAIRLSGDPMAAYRYMETVRSATASDILDVFRTVVDESRALMGVYVNENDLAHAEKLKFQNISFKRDFEMPFSLVDAGGGVKKYISKNGIRILLRRAEGSGTVSIVAVFPGGNVFYSKGGIPNLTAGVITRGTKTRTADMILDEMKAIGGAISAGADFDTFSISAHFLGSKMEKGLEIFFDVLNNPLFDEREIDKVRRDILEDLRTRHDNPQTHAFDEFMKLLFDGTPYCLPAGISEENIVSATRDDVMNFWDFVNSDPEKIVIAIVGDIGSESDVLRKLYLHGRKFFSREKRMEIGFPKKVTCNSGGLERRIRREGKQVHIVAGMCGPTVFEEENIAFWLASASVSGMGGRFFMNLRERKGLAYVVTPIRRSFIAAGLFGGYIASAPDKLEESLRSLLEEIRNVTSIDDREFERGRNIVLGTIRRELQSNSSWASVLARNEFLGHGFDYHIRVQERIKATTKDDVISKLRKYIDEGKISVVVLGPESSGAED